MSQRTAAQRAKAYRLRKAGLLPPLPQCLECGRSHYGVHEELCGYCWRDCTPEGQEHRRSTAQAARVRRAHRQWGVVA